MASEVLGISHGLARIPTSKDMHMHEHLCAFGAHEHNGTCVSCIYIYIYVLTPPLKDPPFERLAIYSTDPVACYIASPYEAYKHLKQSEKQKYVSKVSKQTLLDYVPFNSKPP